MEALTLAATTWAAVAMSPQILAQVVALLYSQAKRKIPRYAHR